MTRAPTARGRSHPRTETFALFLALVAARVLGSVAVPPPNSGCFQNSGDSSPIAGCSCHSSCEKCGYYWWPDKHNDCVTCADGSAVDPVYSDGTGTCGTGGTGTWDVEVPSYLDLFSVPCLMYAGPNPDVQQRSSCPALMKKNEDHWCNMADVMALFAGLTNEQAAVEAAVGDSAEFCLASSERDCCEPDAGPIVGVAVACVAGITGIVILCAFLCKCCCFRPRHVFMTQPQFMMAQPQFFAQQQRQPQVIVVPQTGPSAAQQK